MIASKSTNILFLASTFPRKAGDAQAPFVKEQATAWKAARPSDSVTVLAPHDRGAARAESEDGVDVVRFQYAWPAGLQKLAYPAILPNIKANPLLALLIPVFLISETIVTLSLVKRNKIDCIYAHWAIPQGIPALVANLLFGTPFVLQTHSSDFSVLSKISVVGPWLGRLLIRRCLAYFCVNSHQRDFLLASCLPGERAAIDAKIMVRPMGVASLPDPEDEANNSDAPDIVTISRLSRKKGLDHFIAAIQLLRERGMNPRVAIAGDGELVAELKAQAKDCKIDFLGFLVAEQKGELLTSARAIAVPSVAAEGDVEGLPVSILEALVVGTPLITTSATNIETLPEWNELKHVVYLIPDPADHHALADAIHRVITLSVEDRAKIAVVTRTIAKKYLWENLIHEYIEHIVSRLPERSRHESPR